MVSGGCCSAIRVLRWINLLCFHALLPVRLHHALALLAVRAALAEARTDLEVGLLEPRVACGQEATSRSRRTAEARRPRARGQRRRRLPLSVKLRQATMVPLLISELASGLVMS